MQLKNNIRNIEDYLKSLPDDRKQKIEELIKIINKNIPEGFENTMSYGMIGWVVPKSIYPKGYHCDPILPLPFLNIASQKNFIAIYHMGIYSVPELLNWFTDEFQRISNKKPDMGKSCVRFKDKDIIPYELIAELVKKQTPQDWINVYEKAFKKPA